uniref:Uncharacterized protein n=1 Tax=Oryza nivara TaxID=4536 RepID=A0A0E0I8I5_ORYNI
MASVQAAEMSVMGLFAYPGSSPAKATTLKDLVCGVAEVLPTNKLATREAIAMQSGHLYAERREAHR